MDYAEAGGSNPEIPKVSVVIPTKDRAGLLPRVLDSVLVQDYPNLEIIVSDDGSSDNTREVVRGYEQHGHCIQYLRNETSMGACSARNLGASNSSGDFLVFVDDDDEVRPKLVWVLFHHVAPRNVFVTSACEEIGKAGQRSLQVPPSSIDVNAAFHRQPIGNKALIHREAFERVGGFDASMKASQDYDLYTRLLLAHPGARGRGVWRTLHTKDGSHALERITDTRKNLGKRQFYLKHRQHMTRLQRLYFVRYIMDRPCRLNRVLVIGLLLKRIWLKSAIWSRRLMVNVKEAGASFFSRIVHES